MSRTLDRIQKAAQKRQASWLNGCDPFEIAQLTKKLEELYEQHRLERARDRHGDRFQIVKRARVERELEKLMTQDNIKPH
jgi:hypothetical protein